MLQRTGMATCTSLPISSPVSGVAWVWVFVFTGASASNHYYFRSVWANISSAVGRLQPYARNRTSVTLCRYLPADHATKVRLQIFARLKAVAEKFHFCTCTFTLAPRRFFDEDVSKFIHKLLPS